MFSGEGIYYPVIQQGSSLIFPQWGKEWGSWTDPTDVPAEIAFDKDEIEVLHGLTAQLSASALPWNLSDKKLVFTSADESVATVNSKGVVTGVSLGTTTIRAASRLDVSVYDECSVTIKKLQTTLSGILMDETGIPMFYDWDLSRETGYVRGSAIEHTPHGRYPCTRHRHLLHPRQPHLRLNSKTRLSLGTAGQNKGRQFPKTVCLIFMYASSPYNPRCQR